MRRAAAPISWGVCEVPDRGVQLEQGIAPRDAPIEANDPARDVARSRHFANARG